MLRSQQKANQHLARGEVQVWSKLGCVDIQNDMPGSVIEDSDHNENAPIPYFEVSTIYQAGLNFFAITRLLHVLRLLHHAVFPL